MQWEVVMRIPNFARRSWFLIPVVVLLWMQLGCSSTQKGAAVGGVVGAGAGAVIGNQSGHSTTGAIAGGAIGAAAGAIIGDYMEKQKKELEQVPGADVKLEDDRLIVTFEEAILFGFDSSALRPEAQQNLRQMADVLVRYPDTNLIIIGHTDNVGTDEYNYDLSERRANSVKRYLVSSDVRSGRLMARGYGETAPVESNSTAEGRAKNRRVEVQIAANEQLRQQAEEQAQAEARR
jgi:outer membrane protein OmpA-like peptidoglycan-associated protein